MLETFPRDYRPVYKGSALKKKRSITFMILAALAVIVCLSALYWIANQIDRPRVQVSGVVV